MHYSFNIIGVSPLLSFFNHQLDAQQSHDYSGAEYIGAYRCTLDAFLGSIDTLPQKRGWDLDKAVDTVISFWLNHGTQVKRWQERLDDAGAESVVVGRLATMHSLRSELESLLEKDV